MYLRADFCEAVRHQTSNGSFLELVKARSKVPQKNMSREWNWNLDQWKTFSKIRKPIRVSLWLVCKYSENNRQSILSAERIQTQKRYPTSLDKISIVTWRPLITPSQNFSCELDSWRTYSLRNISHLSLQL